MNVYNAGIYLSSTRNPVDELLDPLAVYGIAPEEFRQRIEIFV